MASEPTTQSRRKQRHRLLTIDSDSGERRVSWLDLFFDLVFVIAVSHVASVLAADTSIAGLVKYTVLFLAVWWAWVGHTFYADRFESDESDYRVITFAAMLAVAAMALRIDTAFTPEGSDAFAVSYSIVLFILAASYTRTAIYVPLARKLALPYIIGLGVSASIFLLSLLVDPPAQFAIWAIGLALALATPFLNAKIARVIPIDHSHIPERFGLFTIIVLGEAVIATANGAASVPWSLLSALIGVFGFAMAACIWWLNFEFVEDDAIKRPVLLPRIIYLYGHYFMVSSVVALGIGIEHAIKESNEAHLHFPTVALIAGGAAVYLAVITIIRVITGVCRVVVPRVAAIVLMLSLLWVGQFVPPVMVIGAAFLLLSASIWLESFYVREEV